jgi:hypothetical protein
MTIKLSIRDEKTAMALAQLCKRFLWEDCMKYADACDGQEKQTEHAESIYRGIFDLQKSLADAGYAPR